MPAGVNRGQEMICVYDDGLSPVRPTDSYLTGTDPTVGSALSVFFMRTPTQAATLPSPIVYYARVRGFVAMTAHMIHSAPSPAPWRAIAIPRYQLTTIHSWKR